MESSGAEELGRVIFLAPRSICVALKNRQTLDELEWVVTKAMELVGYLQHGAGIESLSGIKWGLIS